MHISSSRPVADPLPCPNLVGQIREQSGYLSFEIGTFAQRQWLNIETPLIAPNLDFRLRSRREALNSNVKGNALIAIQNYKSWEHSEQFPYYECQT